MLADSLQVALKEWASVCRALETGRQIVLLRKGGIYEAAGEFEVEHRQFLLFPTYLHQKREMLKPEAHELLEVRSEEPAQITLSSAAVVTDIIRLESRGQMEAIAEQHVWTPPLIEMRFNYRPENPLYLLVLRTYRLSEPVTIANTPAYAGCKSWVPLDEPVRLGRLTPAIDDAGFESRRQAILRKAQSGGGVHSAADGTDLPNHLSEGSGGT